MTRPNPQGTPIPLEAQKPPGRILRPLRAYRPNRHEPPPIHVGPEQTPNGVGQVVQIRRLHLSVRSGAHQPLRLGAHQQTKNNRKKIWTLPPDLLASSRRRS